MVETEPQDFASERQIFLPQSRRSIAENPQIGVIYEEDPKYRTWALQGTSYRLFYWIDEQQQVIHIVAIWSTVRGRKPF